MGSFLSSNKACSICKSERSIIECDECSQACCTQHALEHRHMFTNQWIKTIIQCDILQQASSDREDQYDSLANEIDRWKHDSIDRIQQKADELRRQVDIFIDKCEQEASNKVHDFTESLCKNRQGDYFAKSDLRTLTDKMDKLKRDLTAVTTSLTLREDPANILMTKLCLLSKAPQFVHNESLMRVSGNVEITDDGRAVKSTDTWSDAMVQGKVEYSVGIHKVRFVIGTKSRHHFLHFGIRSKNTPRSQISSVFGWTAEDGVDDPYGWVTVSNARAHMDEEILFEIELTIDCDNRMIRFVNGRTNKTGEMHIDTSQCPFPWQLFVDLPNVEDRVTFLSSN